STPTPSPEIHTLSLHDALPIWAAICSSRCTNCSCRFRTTSACGATQSGTVFGSTKTTCRNRLWTTSFLALIASSTFRPCSYSGRSEEHTSELQSRRDLVCRLLL